MPVRLGLPDVQRHGLHSAELPFVWSFNGQLEVIQFCFMIPRQLNRPEWAQLRLEYETSAERPTLRELADKHGLSRSTVFKRAAREKWKENAALVEATRKQIVEKMEARMEIATTEAADLAAKQFMAELQPWIEREKAEHIKRIVAIAKSTS